MENTKYGKRREGRWTPIRAKAQDTRANPNSWETHLVRKRWDIGLLRALSLRIMMMMNTILTYKLYFRHFHFPVRRTGAYRHKKALPFSHPPLHSFTPLFPSPLSTPQLLIEEMRKSPTHTPPTHLHCWQVLITPKNILTLHLTFS